MMFQRPAFSRTLPKLRLAALARLALPLLVALSAHSAWAQAAAPAAPRRAPGGPNAVTKAAVQRGVLHCAARINQITGFIGYDDQAGVLLMVPAEQADQSLISVSMEIPVEGRSAYVGASFAPNQANGCGATYEAVAYWPQACTEVASRQFAALKAVGPLRKDLAVLDGGPNTKVFLLKAGQAGCVSIKKEAVL